LPWLRTTRISHRLPAAAHKPRGKEPAAAGNRRTSDRRRSVTGSPRPRMCRRGTRTTWAEDLPRTQSTENCASAAPARLARVVLTGRSRVRDRRFVFDHAVGFDGATRLRPALRLHVIECRRIDRVDLRCHAGHRLAARVGACESGVGILRPERRQERDPQGRARPIRRLPASRWSGGGRVGLLPGDEGKARPLEQVNGSPYFSGMSGIGTLSTWWPCWSTTVTNHPCQVRPGLTLPCLSSLASTTAS